MGGETLKKLNPVNNRKIWFSIFVIVAGMVMCLLNKITGSEWIGLAEWVSVAYLGANVAQKHSEHIKDAEITKANASPL